MSDINRKRYKYYAYGLVISSEIFFPEFMEGEGPEDVSIVLGEVPSEIENAAAKTRGYQISDREFLFFQKVADYHAAEGDTITVKIHNHNDAASLRAYITGAAMGAILFQRGLLPMHSSSVVIDGKGYMFTGPSGVGKSTICAAFAKEGYEYLSDDIVIIMPDKSGTPIIQPAFPQHRLCRDAVKALGYDTQEVIRDEKKYVINTGNNFRDMPVPLEAIIELTPKRTRNIELIKITGIDKLKGILNNAYYSEIFLRVYSNQLFSRIFEMANKISYYALMRPKRKYSVKELMDKVVKSGLIS